MSNEQPPKLSIAMQDEKLATDLLEKVSKANEVDWYKEYCSVKDSLNSLGSENKKLDITLSQARRELAVLQMECDHLRMKNSSAVPRAQLMATLMQGSSWFSLKYDELDTLVMKARIVSDVIIKVDSGK